MSQPIEKSVSSTQLRLHLKSFIDQPHRELERLPLMVRYSSGNCTHEEYSALTQCLQDFWLSFTPSTAALPRKYHAFLNTYLASMQLDTGYTPAPSGATRVNELAFFYVLLGSGLGAKVILKNNQHKAFPKNNLMHLAQESGPLWREFLFSYLTADDKHGELAITQTSEQLFTTLLNMVKDSNRISK